ncbi:hypothetical protein [Devosia sp. Leaf64]|uniref:hypothetical protein n=1 Tax=Devosia sp. Leaf64 TaxID=1736229 RepID=UPI000713CBC7|nr:hypothetical protein [Devosia sp. Leaf64]KQN73594.1 hypothetical protein ASE94_04860 [Devosia sp. Leaf64]
MSDDCNHKHTSHSEESYFYKETQRLITELRRIAEVMVQAAEPAPRPTLVPVLAEAATRRAA